MSESTTIPRFVVYALCRPDGTPFYVGRGSQRRPFVHEEYARSSCRCAKCETIRGIWASGNEIGRAILLSTDDEHEAIVFEGDMIALFGLHTLTNVRLGYGYMRDGNRAVPKADAEGACYNRTEPEQLRKILNNLFPSQTDN